MNKLTLILLLFIALCFRTISSFSQSDEPKIISVLKESLSQPELKDYEMVSFVLELKPGFTNEEAHRHGGDLFGYVLEGAIELTMGKEKPIRFEKGQMFHEKHMQLHNKYLNPGSTITKILMVQIYIKGKERYMSDEH